MQGDLGGRDGSARQAVVTLPCTPATHLHVTQLHHRSCAQMCAVAHRLLQAAYPAASTGLEVRLAYAGAIRNLKNGMTVAVSTSTSWRRLAAERARCVTGDAAAGRPAATSALPNQAD